jgi:hypothetical protein
MGILFYHMPRKSTGGRRTVSGFNPHGELQRRVDEFIATSPTAKELAINNRPAFYETAAIVLMFDHDKSLAEAFQQYGIDKTMLRRIALERRAILDALAPKDADRDKVRSQSHH